MSIWPVRKRSLVASQAKAASGSAYICSFCGRPASIVGRMVEGPNHVYICAHCVGFANQIAESNRSHPPAADFGDPTVRWTGHMHVRCYFHLQHIADGQWQASATEPAGMLGVGTSPQAAAHDLQANILAATAHQFATGERLEDYFVNHADKRLCSPAETGGVAV